MVVDALQEVGAARSIVIDEDNVILAGNGVTEAAAEAGITKLRVIDASGDELIAVRRSGLSEEQKRALAIYDNRTGELATWNYEQLKADKDAGLSLQPFWTVEEEIAILSHAEKSEGRTNPDSIPDVRATDITHGDMFELGSHRILCGDSTKPEDVSRLLGDVVPALMVTDPPYGIEYDPTWRAKAGMNKNNKKMGKVANDDRADWTEVWRLFPGQVAYVWHAGLKSSIVQASLELAGFDMRSQIIWAKDRLAISRGDYHWQHEPCWYAVRTGDKGLRTPDRSQTTLWEIPSRDDSGHTHGTQKPVECMARPIRNHLAAEVFEPFSGSGTTIIACEMQRRRCFAIELEPSYVQVAIDRWEGFTGGKARKLP
jgi:DNA modification methylase